MAFINRVCDKVFVINMDKDTKRLSKFDTCMKQNNIVYERFSAIVGSQIKNDSRLTDYCNTFCPDGVKGCALSHRTIWEDTIKNSYKNVLIFEDDAIVDENFDRTFQNIWNYMPKEYDIMFFGSLFGGTDNSKTTSTQNQKQTNDD